MATTGAQKRTEVGDGCVIYGFPGFGSEPYLVSIGSHLGIAAGVVFLTHDRGTWVLRSRREFANVIRYGRIRVNDAA